MAASKSPPVTAGAAPAPEAGKGGLMLWLAVTAGLTVVAAGGGGFIGLSLVGKVKQQLEASKLKVEERPLESRYSGDTAIRELAPIITNLSTPADSMIRLQASIIFDAKAVPNANLMAAEITEDIVTFLRTVPVAQIESASGMQHLREDLNERVAIRSERKVREIIVQSLVIQ